jgi:hypothetical protein
MSTIGSLQVLTGNTSVKESYLKIISPAISLSSTSSTQVVEDVSKTYFYSPNGDFVQIIYTFQLLAAVLDSAPTQGTTNTPVVFQMNVGIPGNPPPKTGSLKYVVDAQIQTKGNSSMSPTYLTNISGTGTTDGVMYFPVTNFFSVTAPGAPYTITITLTKKVVVVV